MWFALISLFSLFRVTTGDDFSRFQQMDSGWLLPRDREAALVAAAALLQGMCAEYSQDFGIAQKHGHVTHGHRLLHSRSSRLLRLAEQLQSIILQAIQHKRRCPHCHRLWNA